ncbi:DUF6286 domain-containing Asp23/Gls24 family envelope stress response protein [Streptomyces sp. NPDC088766]|uniref:DUF6286 domain-containing Asp23/Gls24 family envelope stress response protein n=1 Tax=Streptomyces sp. NPDC088766 TaxID=3365893 RepID=UPI0038114DE6
MTAPEQRGVTVVSDRAVRRIARQAALEALPPGRSGPPAPRVAVSVRGGRAELSLGVTLPCRAPLADTVRDVQEHATERTRLLTGLDVPLARVDVASLTPWTRVPPSPAGETGSRSRTPRRWWSERRVPVAVLTGAAAVACGAFAADLVRVHTTGRPAGAWRTWAVRWLSGHGPGDPAVVAAGGLTAALGLWMILLALTPGRRGQRTVRTSAPRVEAAVDRAAVARVVRHAAAGVEGVTTVRVRLRGRRVSVRAGLAFGDRASAHTAVTAAARDVLDACRLRRGPRLRVTVTPGPVLRKPVPGPGAEGGGAASVPGSGAHGRPAVEDAGTALATDAEPAAAGTARSVPAATASAVRAEPSARTAPSAPSASGGTTGGGR